MATLEIQFSLEHHFKRIVMNLYNWAWLIVTALCVVRVLHGSRLVINMQSIKKKKCTHLPNFSLYVSNYHVS